MYEERTYVYTGKKRFFLVLGVAFMFVGLGLVGLAAYAVFLRSGPEKQWLYVIPNRPSATPIVLGAVSAPVSPLAGQKYTIVIDKIGIDAPVGAYGVDANNVPEVPFDSRIVAWYNFSAEPGSGGNAVFAGHRTWNGDAVFRHLSDLQNGDRIILRGENGAQLVYQVFHTELLDPTNSTAASWMYPTTYDVVTLITCGGDYRKTDDPIFGAEYDKRQVVRAALVRDDGTAPSQAAEPGATTPPEADQAGG
ncbi:MAG TPA: class F sortase [Dehalococcoidia bacterium]|nr:class F sortase [Dehalococcoidia bacterium]